MKSEGIFLKSLSAATSRAAEEAIMPMDGNTKDSGAIPAGLMEKKNQEL